MHDFATYEDNLVNLNSCTIAGQVVKVEATKGKVAGLVFTIGYQKHWATGVQEIPIKCYVSGAERLEKLRWLKPGEWVLISGEVTDRGNVYAFQIEQLSKSGPGNERDAYVERMAEETQSAERC